MPPGWLMDSSWPDFWSDTFKIDSSAYGDVFLGPWYVFTFGGLTRSHCCLPPNARVVSALADAYRMAGLEISPDPVGVVQTRTIDDTTCTAISIATEPQIVYTDVIRISRSQTLLFCVASESAGQPQFRAIRSPSSKERRF